MARATGRALPEAFDESIGRRQSRLDAWHAQNAADKKLQESEAETTRLELAEEALREADARVDRALRGSNVGIWEVELSPHDLRPTKAFFSNFWEQLGYESPDLERAELKLVELVHPDDRAQALAAPATATSSRPSFASGAATAAIVGS